MKLFNYFKRKTSSIQKEQIKEKQVLRKIEDVKPGDMIRFNYLEDNNSVSVIQVLNNNIEERKLFFQITFIMSRTEQWVESYDHYYFRNFATINPVNHRNQKRNRKQSIPDALNKMLKDCEKKDDFETAIIIRDAISKLKK